MHNIRRVLRSNPLANEQSSAPSLKDILASYGDVEVSPAPRTQLLTAKTVSRSWTSIPHVTHHDQVDVTALEAARAKLNLTREAGKRLSPAPFLVRAAAKVLTRLPKFNAVLDEASKTILTRKYVHIGLAIDSPKGLVIGVIRNCDQISVDEIDAEAARLRQKSECEGLSLEEMSGASFTISSLGALGGVGFTPIINPPEVAILGVGRLSETPRRGERDAVEWRQALPLSLSYDHRLINGADAGRFMISLGDELTAISRSFADSIL